MADKTGIEWTDTTWNPIRGCSRVSAGCMNCYAEKQAARIIRCDRGRGIPEGAGSYDGLIARTGQWNGQVRVAEHLLDQPLRWTRGRNIFVNSMSDLFHESLPFEQIAAIFAVMSVTTRHTYQVLTKRPARMLEFFKWVMQAQDEGGEWYALQLKDFGVDDRIIDAWPKHVPWKRYDNCGPSFPYENVHLGVSVENQATADERIPLLLETPAAVRWVSAEPLLGALDLSEYFEQFPDHNGVRIVQRNTGLNWVVAGGESGDNARAMHPAWIRSLRDQCFAADVPLFFKQWGEYAPVAHCPETCKREPTAVHLDGHVEVVPSEAFRHLALRSPGWAGMCRVGKKAAGNTIDGRQHLEWPR